MVTAVLAIAIGAVTGVLSGLGIGGGTLLVLYLTAVTDTAASAAAGINLLYFLSCAPLSVWFHARHHLIQWRIAVPAAVSGAVAALAASLLVPTDSPPWLRRGFGVLLLAVCAHELWQLLRRPHGDTNNG